MQLVLRCVEYKEVILKLIDIGGKKLMTDIANVYDLHYTTCMYVRKGSINATPNIFKLGEKDVIMVKNGQDETILHCTCENVKIQLVSSPSCLRW